MKISATTFLLFILSVVRSSHYEDWDDDDAGLVNSYSRSINNNDYDDYFDADKLLPRTINNDEEEEDFINKETKIKMKSLKAETRAKMESLKEEARIKMEAIEMKENIRKENIMKMMKEEDEYLKGEGNLEYFSIDDENDEDKNDEEELDYLDKDISSDESLDDLDKEILEEDGEEEEEVFEEDSEEEDEEEENEEEESEIFDDLDKEILEKEEEYDDTEEGEEYYFVEEDYEDNDMYSRTTKNDNVIPYGDYELEEDSEEEISPAFYTDENEGNVWEEEDNDDEEDHFLENLNLFSASEGKNYKEDYVDDEEEDNMMSSSSSEMMMETDPDDMMIVANDKIEEMIIGKMKNAITLENGDEEGNIMKFPQMDNYKEEEEDDDDDEDDEEGDEYMTLVPEDEDVDEFEYSSEYSTYQEKAHKVTYDDLNSQEDFTTTKTAAADTDPSSEDYLMGEDVNYDINSHTKARDDNSNEKLEYFSLEGDDVEYDEEDDDDLDLEITLEDDEEEEEIMQNYDDDDDEIDELFVDEFDLDEEQINARAFSGRSGGADDNSMGIKSRSAGGGGGNADDNGGLIVKIFAASTAMFTVVLVGALYIRRSHRKSQEKLPNLFVPTGVTLQQV